MGITLHLKRTDRAPEEVNLSDTQHIILRDQDIERIDLSPLKDCTDLRELELHQNYLESVDLRPLSSCAHLQYLSLSTNNLATVDLTPLGSCENLKELVMHRNGMQRVDLGPLSSCRNLHELGLSENALESIDLAPLSSCTNLRELWLSKNHLGAIDLTPLASCSELQDLYLAANRLSEIDLKPLSSCHLLRKLEISFNKLTSIDLRPLQNAKNLVRLTIQNNEITSLDLSPLFYCTNLQTLYIERNNFPGVDLTPLALFESLSCTAFDRTFEADSAKLRRIDILFSQENFWELCYDERGKAHHDMPVSLNDVAIIAGICPRVVDSEPPWKTIHLLHDALSLLGWGWCGVLDTEPKSLLQDILSSPESPSISDRLVSLVSEQISRRGTTTRLDVDRMMDFPDLARKADDVRQLRTQEMKMVEIGTTDSMFDLRALLLTAHGNQVLSSLGYGVRCDKDGLDDISASMSKLGFELRVVDALSEGQLTRLTPALTDYIWNLAEYNSIRVRGISRRLKKRTLEELGLI